MFKYSTCFSGPRAGESVSRQMFSNGSCFTSFCFLVENTHTDHHKSLMLNVIKSTNENKVNIPVLCGECKYSHTTVTCVN